MARPVDLYRGRLPGTLHSRRQKTSRKLGDVVDVVGFPAMGEYSLMLEDAVFKPEGGNRAIAASSITAQDAMKGDYDANLVQIQGRLVNQDLTSEYPTLVMSSGGMSFFALLPSGTKAETISSWRTGSELLLTGVCSVQVDKYLSDQREGAAMPMSFRVLLRSPHDVVVLSKRLRGGRPGESLPCWQFAY